MADALTMTLPELAAVLHRTVPRASLYIAKMAAEQGFPAPLAGRKPKLWSRAQVEAWFRQPGRAPALSPAANDAALDPAFSPENIAAAQARLAQRYGAR